MICHKEYMNIKELGRVKFSQALYINKIDQANSLKMNCGFSSIDLDSLLENLLVLSLLNPPPYNNFFQSSSHQFYIKPQSPKDKVLVILGILIVFL